jgi:hypothetical protein
MVLFEVVIFWLALTSAWASKEDGNFLLSLDIFSDQINDGIYLLKKGHCRLISKHFL